MEEKLANKNLQSEEILDSYSERTVSAALGASPLGHKSYHEMADIPVVEVDVLAQLHKNIETLTDLQSRLAFMMREIRYLLKV